MGAFAKFGRGVCCVISVMVLVSGRVLGCASEFVSEFADTSASTVYRIAFYNTENYFHPTHDTLKNDYDFTPTGVKGWGNAKFTAKRNNLFKVVAALDAEAPLLALGLAEVENALVLRELCRGTPLRFLNFDFVHFESPDPRGIDVALLYRRDLLRVDTAFPIAVAVPPDTVSRTRDILYVKAVCVQGEDTLHFFVNHFPSKYGGVTATEHKRAYAAGLLRRSMDEVVRNDTSAFVVAMGDLNTGCEDAALAVLDSLPWVNLMARKSWRLDRRGKKAGGSHKFREAWSTIDHIIVGQGVMGRIEHGKACLFDRDFLLMKDERYLGYKPLRTFYGAKYLGGYSDHLPVYIDVRLP